MINGIKIMNLEGSDILKNNLEGRIINKKYNGVFTNSLLFDKVKELGLKISKFDTIKDIIVVDFTYGYTPKKAKDITETIKKNTDQYKNLINQKNELLEQRKIQYNNKDKKSYTDQIEKISQDIKNLKEENKKSETIVEQSKINKKDLRKILYENGFYIDFQTKDEKIETIEYVFWFRSPSKSKIGSICFINKKLFDKINEWQTMGIKLTDTNAKLVEMEAYKSLTSSAIERKIILNPVTDILVVNDLDSFIEEVCCKVYVKDNKECDVVEETMSIKNTIWDGMSLLDNSLWEKGDKSSIKVLRQHFFKSCSFRTDIAKFMKDYFGDNYDTATVKDRYGRTVFVKNIKCILTENSLKWEKLTGNTEGDYNYWCSKVNEDNNVFGVCKVDHDSKYKSYQRMSYQMINSLPIDKIQAKELCQDSVDFVDKLKRNDKIFLDFLDMTKSEFNANEMMIDLYNNNPKFANSEFFRKFRVKTISEYKETLRAGKLLTYANNLTVCGNPYPLLLHSVGALSKYIIGNIIDGYEDPTLPILDEGVSVYTTKFNNQERMAAFRSPHNAPHNTCYFINYKANQDNKDDFMNKYFKFNRNVIAINLIKTNVQNRMNGLDEDSDFCYVTNSSVCVQASIDAQKYKTIVNKIKPENRTYDNTMLELAKIDNELATSKLTIGQSSNISALALSWYWNDTTNKELEKVVIICSVLAQVSIDNCKRLYDVDLPKEIARISKLPCMQVKINEGRGKVVGNYDGKTWLAKPYFWQYVKEIKEKEEKVNTKIDKSDNEAIINAKIEAKQKSRKNKLVKEKDLVKHCLLEKLCPMDFIQDAIDDIKPYINNHKYTDDIEFIKTIKGKAETRQMNRAKEIVKELDDFYKEHFDNMGENYINDEDDDNWMIEQLIKTEDILKKLKKIKMTEKTMQMLVYNTLSDDNFNKKYKRRLLNCLYKSNKNRFLSLFYTKDELKITESQDLNIAKTLIYQ